MRNLTQQRQVLMLAYYFPPFAGVASQRSEKFSKYLPKYGWRPKVFTLDPRYYGIRVIRSPEYQSLPEDTIDTYYRAAPLTAKNPNSLDVKRISFLKLPASAFTIKLAYPVLALWYAARNKKSLDAIYISGSPFHSFLLTPLLTKMLNVPTVINFRDSWSINNNYDDSRPKTLKTKIRQGLLKQLEAISIRFASQVVFATSKLRTEYAELFPQWTRKFHIINNGFDPEDIAESTPSRPYQKTTLIFAGKFHFYTPSAVDSLMQALRNKENIAFLYVGEEHLVIDEAAQRHHITDRVMSLPFQPQIEVMRLIAGADIGLMSNSMANGLGTKIFEYLSFDKPVVCLVPHDSVVVQEFGSTSSVLISHPPHTPEKICKAIDDAMSLIGKNHSVKLDAFNRRKNTGKLAKLLDEISRSAN